jgi:hypothetical protein
MDNINKEDTIAQSTIKEDNNKDISKLFIDFLLQKRQLHMDVYRGIEQKAIHLMLFVGVVISLLVSIGDSPLFEDNIIEIGFGISFYGLPLSLYFFILAILFGLGVLINSFFLDTFTENGFLKGDIEIVFTDYLCKQGKYVSENKMGTDLSTEIFEELKLLRKKNRRNSVMLMLGLILFALGVITLIWSILEV